jgi:predicted neuraminidase
MTGAVAKVRGIWVFLAAMNVAAFDVLGQVTSEAIAQQPGFVFSEFVAQKPETVFSHSSTIVQTKSGDLMCAWMGGSKERFRDVGIWAARFSSNAWSKPVEIANGIHDKKHLQNALWNPVLYVMPNGSLVLFSKEGASPASWWGMYKLSYDNGVSWGPEKKMPTGYYGPVRNKPITLPSGTILCGSSVESTGWVVHMERTRDLDQWTKGEPINSSLAYGGAIQPTLIPYADGRIQALCRTKHGKIFGSWTEDAGYNWSRLKEIDLPNPNGAIDAVMLKDGRGLLVYNHSQTERNVMNIATTRDGAKWEAAMLLENEPGSEFSYPAVIQTADGMVHITYTWKKIGIKHVVVNPSRLNPRPMFKGQWQE